MQNDNSKFKSEFKHRLYSWVIRLINFISSLNKEVVSEVMGKQLLRSGTSILANYVEANSASSKKDFINFFTHSLKSANESKVWISLMKDTGRGNTNELEWLMAELIEISNILASSMPNYER
ncbi:MAG: hypothetical protein A3B23_02590 [Candidatus Colwellbacteria bacterium RIFCSPLOWO2_01_FULL_48_10]|uniref:Four helix bundle protein n=1 Tax=Candidatus Colwellbacteria bacterium RIFCSPLOWO2_01_FULL_48_10 TaxID=1797690 RepID=A0A1G1Z698_9BACT|nr:MAG: hypothetical protein A3B23_02590 [Candidatus Colwellbacteria bacterium RIFCSPLOWO2_01_FULL_48_10]